MMMNERGKNTERKEKGYNAVFFLLRVHGDFVTAQNRQHFENEEEEEKHWADVFSSW